MVRSRTEPFPHQTAELEFSKDLPARAIFWEQGTGKTKLIIDNTTHLYDQQSIDALVIVAPDGVHRNWIVEEIPKHIPEDIFLNSRMHWYQTSKKLTKWHQQAVKEVTNWRSGLAVLAMTFDSIMTKEGRRDLWMFLKERRCMYVADESSRIKTPGAKRTIRVVASGAYAPYRRILNGTPVPNSPFDVFSQIKFVDDEYWKREGISTFQGFKTTFGIWVNKSRSGGKDYPELAEYIHLDRLHRLVSEISSRVTKDEVLDLPPKIYTKIRFELSPEQRRAYDSLKEEFMVLLNSGEVLTAPLAIVRLLRLQQICCGYLPSDDIDGPLLPLGKTNPRLDLFGEVAQDLPHKAIVWARFRQDIDNILGKLSDMKLKAVRYDGRVDDEGRADALEQFKRGDAQFFVANPQAAGTGLTLTEAKTVMYYSNSFNLMDRLQSEDRAHRIGQDNPVNYIDFIADNTVDWHIVGSLVSKLEIANIITGDNIKEWL